MPDTGWYAVMALTRWYEDRFRADSFTPITALSPETEVFIELSNTMSTRSTPRGDATLPSPVMLESVVTPEMKADGLEFR